MYFISSDCRDQIFVRSNRQFVGLLFISMHILFVLFSPGSVETKHWVRWELEVPFDAKNC